MTDRTIYSRCQSINDDCKNKATWQCESWVRDRSSASGFSPHSRALCDEHAGWYMRANSETATARRMRGQEAS